MSFGAHQVPFYRPPTVRNLRTRTNQIVRIFLLPCMQAEALCHDLYCSVRRKASSMITNFSTRVPCKAVSHIQLPTPFDDKLRNPIRLA